MKLKTFCAIPVVLSLLATQSCVAGFSDDDQKKIYDSLVNYNDKRKSSKQVSNTKCRSNEEYPTTTACLEEKYMSNGLYVVLLSFKPIHEESRTLPKVIPHQNWEFEGAELQAFFEKWRVPLLTEYIGEDFGKFSEAELQIVNDRKIGIKLSISHPDEILDVLKDPRLFGVIHIARPDTAPEEGR